jgi:hypothetical protein
MKNILAILLTGIIFFTCEPEYIPVKTFVIRKGNHHSTPRVSESLQSDKLSFEARFDESAIYDLGDTAIQSNKNKLLGFSDCNSLHHQNSARFAWQWFNDKLEIYAYCYVNGDRREKFVGVVETNEYNRYEIQLKDDEYIFRLNNLEPVRIERGNVCDYGLYYKLWPYFGGSLPAPHDVEIEIKTLY